MAEVFIVQCNCPKCGRDNSFALVTDPRMDLKCGACQHVYGTAHRETVTGRAEKLKLTDLSSEPISPVVRSHAPLTEPYPLAGPKVPYRGGNPYASLPEEEQIRLAKLYEQELWGEQDVTNPIHGVKWGHMAGEPDLLVDDGAEVKSEVWLGPMMPATDDVILLSKPMDPTNYDVLPAVERNKYAWIDRFIAASLALWPNAQGLVMSTEFLDVVKCDIDGLIWAMNKAEVDLRDDVQLRSLLMSRRHDAAKAKEGSDGCPAPLLRDGPEGSGR